MNIEIAKAFYQFIESQGHRIPLKRKLIYGFKLTQDDLKVNGYLDLRDTPITQLPNNLKVGGSLYLQDTKITQLPNNLKVGGSLYLQDTKITQLPNNLKVGGSLDITYTPITQLPNNLKVGGTIFVDDDKTEYFKKIAPEHLKNKIK